MSDSWGKVWTAEDTKICEEADKTGIAVNRLTGKDLTWDELVDIHERLPY